MKISSECVMAGLDLAIHPFREKLFTKKRDPRVKPAGDGWGVLRDLSSPQQIARCIKRDEREALLAEIFLGALQPIDESDDTLDARAAPTHRGDRLHHRAALGGDVVEQDDGAAGLEIAVDLALGAVVLDLLAHHEAGDGAAVPAARAHGDDDRHRAELEAADRIDLLVLDEIEDELGDEMRPLRVEHRRLHVEVVVAHRAGHELEFAEEQRFLLDDLEQARLLLRERGRPLRRSRARRAGLLPGRFARRRLASSHHAARLDMALSLLRCGDFLRARRHAAPATLRAQSMSAATADEGVWRGINRLGTKRMVLARPTRCVPSPVYGEEGRGAHTKTPASSPPLPTPPPQAGEGADRGCRYADS